MNLFLFNLAIILGAIFFAYFSWRKIELGILTIVFCLPLYLVRLNIFGVPSTVLELVIYILFAIWFIKNSRHIKLREIIPDRMLGIGIILLLAGATISTILSSDLKTSAGILKGWFFDPFLFFIILVSEIRTLKQKENILKALYFSGSLVALVSLVYLIFPALSGVSYDGRLHGFYLSPNYLAMYLAPALIVGIYVFLKSDFKTLNIKTCQPFSITMGTPLPPCCSPRFDQGEAGNLKQIGKFWRSKGFNLFILLIIFLALSFTYSYAAWFAAAVAVFLLIYLIAPKKRKIFFGVVFLILFVSFFGQSGTGKFENLKDLSYRSSYNSRLMIWRSAWEIGKDNWLTGIGPGNFQKYYLDYQIRFSEPYLEWAVPEPHNIFLAFWLETGILGLAGFFVILAWFFKKSVSLLSLSLRGIRPLAETKQSNNFLDRENFLLIAALFSLMVYTVVHGLFDTTYWKNDLAIIFWLNLGLLAAIKKNR
ncbi:MAG: O-antigen ligase family protein [bacterium]|nr:O-antigen ligase family protein [bacterium]